MTQALQDLLTKAARQLEADCRTGFVECRCKRCELALRLREAAEDDA